MRYRLPGRPIPLQRPRFSKKTAKVFDNQKEVKFYVGIMLKQQHGNAPLFTGPLKLRVLFSFGTDDRALWGKPYIGVPDTSNLLKFVEDCATRILYKDDSLITDISCVKMWSEASYTEFVLTEL